MPKIIVEVDAPDGGECGWDTPKECIHIENGEYCCLFRGMCLNRRLPQCIAAEVKEKP